MNMSEKACHMVAPVAFFPPKQLSIKDLSQIERFQAERDDFESKYGYNNLYITDGQDHIDLAIGAAQKCLAESQVGADSIDAVLVSSHFQNSSWERLNPFRVHQSLSLRSDTTVSEIQTGNCTGYLECLMMARAMLLSEPKIRRVLVIGTDAVDRRFVRRRIGKRVFGDGACACLVERDSPQPSQGKRFAFERAPSVWFDPQFLDLRQIDASQERLMLMSFLTGTKHVIADAIRQASLRIQDIQLVVTTNYDKTLWDFMLKEHAMPPELRFGETLSAVGHVATSDVLYNLLAANRKGLIVPGKHILMVSLGIGLSCQALVLKNLQ